MAALMAAIESAVACQQGGGHDVRVCDRDSAVEGQSAGADLGELGEELPHVACMLGAGVIQEAVHLVVGDVGEQDLSGGARVEGTARVGTRGERQAG